jgi:hypothetical protein
LPKQSTYFIQIVFVGTVISTSIEILRIVPLIKAAIRPLLPPNLTQNEREKPVFGIASLSNPPEFSHADCSAQIVRIRIQRFYIVSSATTASYRQQNFLFYEGAQFYCDAGVRNNSSFDSVHPSILLPLRKLKVLKDKSLTLHGTFL